MYIKCITYFMLIRYMYVAVFITYIYLRVCIKGLRDYVDDHTHKTVFILVFTSLKLVFLAYVYYNDAVVWRYAPVLLTHPCLLT